MALELNETKEETEQFQQMQQELPIETPQPDKAEEAPKEAEAPAEPPKVEEPPKPEPKPDDPEKAKLARQVPFAAVLEERQKRKAAEATLAELRRQATQPEAPKQPTDPNDDPIAVIRELQTELNGFKSERERTVQESAFANAVVQEEQQYVAEVPDYPQAVEYLKNFRVTQMRALGMPDQQIMQMLANEARDTALYARQTDQRAPELFYALAKASGYVQKVAETAPVVVQPDPAAVSKLAALSKGQRASKSVSDGGGGAASPAPSLAAIAELEGADFDAAWKSGAVKRLMQ